jgi:hypothetical protein
MEPDLRQLVFLADGFEPMADALGVCRGAIFFDGDIPGMIAPFNTNLTSKKHEYLPVEARVQVLAALLCTFLSFIYA